MSAPVPGVFNGSPHIPGNIFQFGATTPDPGNSTTPTASVSKSVCIDSTNAKDFQGRTIKLVLGGRNGADIPKVLFVHEKVLSASSDFFKKAVKQDWSQLRDDPDTIDMSDDRFETVNAYIHWLYTGQLPVPSAKDRNRYMVLSEVYIFGEKIMDSRFKNDVLSSLIAWQCSSNTTPSSGCVNLVFKGTVIGSPLRRFMVDMIAQFANSTKNWTDAIKACDKEVLVEVCVAMASIRQATKCRPWAIANHNYREA